MFSLQNVSVVIQALTSFVAYILTISPVGYFKAWMASRCGDDTAQQEGFMSFDPLVHFDFVGILALFLLGVGWGRNIPININLISEPYRRLKMALILFSTGIMHALLTCLAACLLYISFGSKFAEAGQGFPLMLVIARIFIAFILLNSFLAVMNFFISCTVLIALIASERYAHIAQNLYYIILIGPLAIILLLELLGLHVLSFMHYLVLHMAFSIGQFIAGLVGIH